MEKSRIFYGVKVRNNQTGLYTIYIYENKYKAEQVTKGIKLLKRLIKANNITNQRVIEYEMFCIFEGYVTFIENVEKHQIEKSLKYGKETEELKEKVYNRKVRLLSI